MQRIIAFIMTLFTFVFSFMYQKPAQIDRADWNTNYQYVFVHGLSGWGSYDIANKALPYWGMFGGSLISYLNKSGFDCYAASVAPQGSAWDRACELYAQLSGTVVDYGKEHSARCGHDRFGTDYSKRPLLTDWSAQNKINILGHSFGGATIRLFASLMAEGSNAERAATDDGTLSPFFAGNKGDWIYSVITLAAPHNGTSIYNTNEEDAEEKTQNAIGEFLSGMMDKATAPVRDGRLACDYADYDMYIDHALALNESIVTFPQTYYFSYSCSASVANEEGVFVPEEDIMERLFIDSSKAIGAFTGVTENGFVIDESWRENDGLVNTISEKAPSSAPAKDFDADAVEPGIWNIMPVYHGDHMSLQGGLIVNNNVKPFYLELFSMINSL